MTFRHAGKMETYESSVTGRALLIDPLRAFATARLALGKLPVYFDLVDALLNTPGKIDQSFLTSATDKPLLPILIADGFSTSGETEIVDGNHAYVRYAISIRNANQIGSQSLAGTPTVPAYLISGDIWTDFLADPQTKLPKNGKAIDARLKGIDHGFGFRFSALGHNKR